MYYIKATKSYESGNTEDSIDTDISSFITISDNEGEPTSVVYNSSGMSMEIKKPRHDSKIVKILITMHNARTDKRISSHTTLWRKKPS